MDEYLTDGYSEPCAQCAAVDWGVSVEEQFFCKKCHNVIERTIDMVGECSLYSNHSKISYIARPKNTAMEFPQDWMVCEGFQFVLKQQADALVSLGVCLQFKTDVMWNFWKRYLQNTRQAFVNNPVSAAGFSADLNSESKSKPESVAFCEESFLIGAPSEAEKPASGCSNKRRSGSLDASLYVKGRKSRNVMTMPRTLALCYLALLWVREAITLADLLRLVKERCVPYLNIHEYIPKDMRIYGQDSKIFRVDSIPSYSTVHKEAVELAKVIKLPAFPTVSQDCLLHPIPLTVRYLLESNLPDGLLVWVHKVIDEASMGDDSFLTFDPVKQKPALVCYDIQAAAVIIVTMKLLFKLDDRVEWTSSWKAASEKKKKVFNVERWYKVMQPAFERARQKMEREEARQLWKSHEPFITSLKDKSLVFKKRRVVNHLQHRFQKLTDSTPEQQCFTTTAFSSFQFHWGRDDGSYGRSLHQHRLNCTFKKKGVKRLTNRKFWHTVLSVCPPTCSDHFSEIEASLPRMYVWLLDLFSFLLGVSQAQVHKEVLNIERRFLKRKRPPVPKSTQRPSVTKKTPRPSATKKTPRPSATKKTPRPSATKSTPHQSATERTLRPRKITKA
ncbi:TATA box-binding protein-associated factor RNA polymerase I subunit B-like isoform X2 [Triplophysa rosa]|uniref:TATA box-binding protein-associated factor RNA polymerase I subunit B n=1 Tax=Triplophysa rosa TaxID=992332 RepID=A0A9W7TND0_TRIRA|nr:TATA box-binding protein-associated factor RNA polymerase I subunit B-like isoform X2 [Triplophysa rosa]KAI7799566.1 TATA box-binding protein-associated factor RNA polymerase I subunit B [Triplophysa rosa]